MNTINNNPITIFIHGTLYPGLSLLIRAFDLPLGITQAKKQANRLLHGRIAYLLNESDPQRFNLDNFYFFGWSGQLNPKARKEAAYTLYDQIKDFNQPVQIIGYSHGGNIALNLAEIIKEKNNYNFKIAELILIACPVVAITEEYIYSPIFENILSFYSEGDITQTIDPQYLFKDVRQYAKKSGKNISFFSKRLFHPCPKLTQIRVLYNKRNMRHIEFLHKPFIKNLPFLINLTQCSKSDQTKENNIYGENYTINIPKNLNYKPELLIKNLK